MTVEVRNTESSGGVDDVRDDGKHAETDADMLLLKDADNKPTSTSGLKRQVNLLGGICLLVGTIIGSGT